MEEKPLPLLKRTKWFIFIFWFILFIAYCDSLYTIKYAESCLALSWAFLLGTPLIISVSEEGRQ